MDLVAARTPEEKLIWAFKMYDVDNSGVIDRKEMENVMKSIYQMLGERLGSTKVQIFLRSEISNSLLPYDTGMAETGVNVEWRFFFV